MRVLIHVPNRIFRPRPSHHNHHKHPYQPLRHTDISRKWLTIAELAELL
jgi:hypothetical protein